MGPRFLQRRRQSRKMRPKTKAKLGLPLETQRLLFLHQELRAMQWSLEKAGSRPPRAKKRTRRIARADEI